jgi:trypsin
MKLIIFLAAILFGCQHRESSDPKLVNGESASERGEYPWMATLQTEGGDHHCGGSLIAPNLILTAAHCYEYHLKEDASEEEVELYEEYKKNPHKIAPNVKIGKVFIDRPEQGVENRKVKKVVIHPKRDVDDTGFGEKWDLAILVLDRSSRHDPIAYNKDEDFPEVGDRLEVIGWGKTGDGRNDKTDELLHINVSISDPEDCQRQLLEGQNIADYELCALPDRKGGKTCQGDSGGPLFTRQFEEPLLVGAVSWGNRCESKSPSVFSNISSSKGWIAEMIRKHGDD